MNRSAAARLRAVTIPLAIGVLLAGVLVALATPAQASTIVVDTFDDTWSPPDPDNCNGGAGPCTLRDAIEAANHETGHTTIELPEGTYTLDASAEYGALRVHEDLTIVGLGDGATIEQPADTRILTVWSAALTIDNLTLTGGDVSGAEYPENVGGAILLASVSPNGTPSPPSLEVVNSTFAGNTAASGGAIGAVEGRLDLGAVTISGSTFTGNSAVAGSAVYLNANDADGIDIVNSTFSGNTATSREIPWAAIYAGTFNADLVITNSTIADNAGGGVFTDEVTEVTVRNTILAGNTGSDGATPANCTGFGIVTSQGHNVVDDDTCGFAEDGDQAETDPQLEPLGDNGGPTATHAIGEGSPAYEGGDTDLCPATDQRGEARKLPETCDVGAFEFVPVVEEPEDEPEEEPEEIDEAEPAEPVEDEPDYTG